MNSDYYSSEHVCKEECPCHLLRSRFKDDKGDSSMVIKQNQWKVSNSNHA